jgi:hypothetical protein
MLGAIVTMVVLVKPFFGPQAYQRGIISLLQDEYPKDWWVRTKFSILLILSVGAQLVIYHTLVGGS